MLNNTLRLNFCYLKIIHILYPHYHPKITQHTLKNKQKNMYVCIHEIIQVILTKMKKKMENRSNRYDMDANIDLHGYKFSNCKKCLSMMMLIRIKQHLGDIWSWIPLARFLTTTNNSNYHCKNFFFAKFPSKLIYVLQQLKFFVHETYMASFQFLTKGCFEIKAKNRNIKIHAFFNRVHSAEG